MRRSGSLSRFLPSIKIFNVTSTTATNGQQNTKNSKTSKQITAEFQFAINMFKATEMAMKNQLDLLEKTIKQRKSFRSLSLLIERTRANEKELTEMSQNVMKQQPRQNTASSFLSRQAKLINRLNELQLQIDLLDNDGQLSQSSQRIRDDISMISSKENRSHQSTPVSIDNNEDNLLQRNLEQQKSSTAHPNQPPAIPLRPERPTLFLQQSAAPRINFKSVLDAHHEIQKCKTEKSVSMNIILQELITTFTILSHKPMIHLFLTVQLMTLNMPLSTLIAIEASHPTVSTQPRLLSTTVKQMKTT